MKITVIFLCFWITVIFISNLPDRVSKSSQNIISRVDKVQEDTDGEYPQQVMTLSVNNEKIDRDSALVLFSTIGLLGLLKEYRAYCDTVTIGRWEYFATPVMTDSTYRTWKPDSSLVRFPRKQYGLMPLFPEDFIYWLETVKLK
jgi:hypothetical protein